MSKSTFIAVTCVVAVCLFCNAACVQDRGAYTPNLPKHKVATLDEALVARVLVPAGSSVNQFIRGGHDEPRPYDFLPYPGNWAEFVHPDLSPFDILILTDALAEGSTLRINPIAVLQLDSAGVHKDIIISVPTDSLLKSLQLEGFTDLITDYEPVRYILQTWFVNHRGFGTFEVIGWRDESYARKLLSDAYGN